MIILRKVLVVAALGSLALGGSMLAAAPADENASEVTAGAETQANLTPAEMKNQSELYLKDMQTVLVQIVELQQMARKQKDVIKLNCVNDKLLQIKQLLNIAEGGRTDMIEAIAQQDQDETTHQFSQISIAKEKTDGLYSEAQGCIGEELVFLGPTEVIVDEGNVSDDPTGDDVFGEGADVLDPPAYASPFS